MADSPEATSGGLPGWVRNTLIAIGVLLVLIVVVMMATGGNHGPGQHMGSFAPLEQLSSRSA